MTIEAKPRIPETEILGLLRDDESRVSLAVFSATQFYLEEQEKKLPDSAADARIIGRICIDDYRDLTDMLDYRETNGEWAPVVAEDGLKDKTDFDYLQEVVADFKGLQTEPTKTYSVCTLPVADLDSTPVESLGLPPVRELEPKEKDILNRFLQGGSGDVFLNNYHLSRFAVFLIKELFGGDNLDQENLMFLPANYALTLRAFSAEEEWPGEVIPECDVYDKLAEWTESIPESTTIYGKTMVDYVNGLAESEANNG